MKGIIISESLVIRKGVSQILSSEDSIESLDEGYMCTDIKKNKYGASSGLLFCWKVKKTTKNVVSCKMG